MQGNLKQKITSGLAVAVLLLYFGGRLYFMSDFNEKYFDLPVEISYAEVPAVRLEKLTDEPLTRTGDAIDPEMEGLRFEADFTKGRMYEIQKEMGTFENYGLDYRHELESKKHLKTEQEMQTADGVELWLDTEYYAFRSENSAGRKYTAIVEREQEMDAYWEAEGLNFPERKAVMAEDNGFDDIHICTTDWTDSVSTHAVCRKGTQVMELEYNAPEMVTEKLLQEIKAVFAAQD